MTVTLMAGLLGLAWSGSALASSSQLATVCGTDGLIVARMIVQRALGTVPDDVDMLAINDVQCSPTMYPHQTPHMANVVVATVVAKQRLYSIFHVHFDVDATVQSLAWLHPWVQFHGDEWREAWCHFIRTVYAADAAVQGCERSPHH